MINSWQRIGALVLRHFYLMRGSWARVLEMIYWPILNVVTWGLISQFFMQHSSLMAQATGLLLGAVLLWDVLFRGQLGVSVSFLEELWSRNLVNLFVSALRPIEFVASLLILSMIRITLCVIPAMLLAIPLYHYSIFELGFPLIIFFINLMVMSWWLGLIICGLLLRLGMGAESLAWAAIFLLSPLAGIYYPIATLPEWAQHIAYMLPTAYVFEGMRSIMLDHIVPWGMFMQAAILNAIYLCVGCGFFLYAFHCARRDGRLLAVSE